MTIQQGDVLYLHIQGPSNNNWPAKVTMYLHKSEIPFVAGDIVYQIAVDKREVAKPVIAALVEEYGA